MRKRKAINFRGIGKTAFLLKDKVREEDFITGSGSGIDSVSGIFIEHL